MKRLLGKINNHLKKYIFQINYNGLFNKLHFFAIYESLINFKLVCLTHEDYCSHILYSLGEQPSLKSLVKELLKRAKKCNFVIFDTPNGFVQLWLASGGLEVCWYLDVYDKSKWKKDSKLILKILNELDVPRCKDVKRIREFNEYFAFLYLHKSSVGNVGKSGLSISKKHVPIFRVEFGNNYDKAASFVVEVLYEVYSLKNVENLKIDLQ